MEWFEWAYLAGCVVVAWLIGSAIDSHVNSMKRIAKALDGKDV